MHALLSVVDTVLQYLGCSQYVLVPMLPVSKLLVAWIKVDSSSLVCVGLYHGAKSLSYLGGVAGQNSLRIHQSDL